MNAKDADGNDLECEAILTPDGVHIIIYLKDGSTLEYVLSETDLEDAIAKIQTKRRSENN